MTRIEIAPWRRGEPVDATGSLLLHPDGPPLTEADRGKPLLLLDSSWQHLPVLLCDLRGDFSLRSIPDGIETAYPRRSKLFADPGGGLATIEALFVASAVVGDPRHDALATYRHADEFLAKNRARLDAIAPARNLGEPSAFLDVRAS
jgi:pre-rRNA-processing protein TSR3